MHYTNIALINLESENKLKLWKSYKGMYISSLSTIFYGRNVRSRGAYNLDRVKLLNVNIAGPKSIFIGAAKSHYRFAVCGPNIDGNVNIVAAKAAPALNAPKSLHIETSMLRVSFKGGQGGAFAPPCQNIALPFDIY